MSTDEHTDPKQKSKKEFLTLADKKPSLIRLSGNESMSARTISTRELSGNLQRTRDGMIKLMQRKQLHDEIKRDRISESDDEDENAQDFDMPIQRKPGRGKDAARTGGVDGSLDDITKRKRRRGQLEEFDSGEFAGDDSNKQRNLLNQNTENAAVLKAGMNKTKKSERGKNDLGSDSDMSRKRFGQFFNENDKRFTSQNPKKDGPLSARIYIDAFLPSLEGNRIFPMFNYRCAEIIDRSSKDFNERNRKRLNNQLMPVSSSTPVQELKDDSLETSTGQLIHKTEDVKNNEKIFKVEEYQNADGSKRVDPLQATEDLRGLNATNEHQVQGGKMHNLQQKIESQEVLRIHDLQQVEELHKVNEIEKTLVLETNSDRTNRTNVVDNSMVNSQNQSTVVGETKHEIAELATQNVPQNQSQPSSRAEEDLLQKVLRILMENEELVNFFCEKVITKIAAKNDFCGPNCNGICGGLNNPSKAK